MARPCGLWYHDASCFVVQRSGAVMDPDQLSRKDLLARMAEMQRQMEALQRQLNAEVTGSGAAAQDNGVAAGAGGVAISPIGYQ